MGLAKSIAITSLGSCLLLMPYPSCAQPQQPPAQTEDASQTGLAQYEAALALIQQGRYREAIAQYNMALELVRKTGDREGEGLILSSLGEVHRLTGELETAVMHLKAALPILQTSPNRTVDTAVAHNNLGLTYNSLGQLDLAQAEFQLALAKTSQLKEPGLTGRILNNMGLVAQNQNQPEAALSYYQKALPLSQQAQDPSSEATTLNNLGFTYGILKQPEKSILHYEQALSLLGKSQRADNLIAILQNLAATYRNLSQPQKALQSLDRGLAIAQQQKDQTLLANIQHLLSLNYAASGDPQKALTLAQQSLDLAKTIQDNYLATLNLNQMGLIAQSQGDYDKALNYYKESLTNVRQMGDRADESRVLNNFGEIYRLKGDYPAALAQYQQALKISQDLKDQISIATTLNNIGITQLALGDYSQALSNCQAALDLAQSLKLTDLPSPIHSNLGEIYRALGQYEKAINAYQTAAEIAQRNGNPTYTANALNNLGLIFNLIEDYAEASQAYETAIQIYERTGDRYANLRTINNLGQLYAAQQQFDRAQIQYEKALQLQRQISSRSGEGMLLNNLGLLATEQKKWDKALTYYQQSLAASQALGDRYTEGLTLTNLGLTQQQQKNLPAAEQSVRAAIKIWETLRLGLNDSNKVSFQETIRGSYILLQEILIQQNQPEAALEIAERGKARALIELLAQKGDRTEAEIARLSQPISLDQIRATAKAQNATLVEYSLNRGKLFIWAIQPNGTITFKAIEQDNTLLKNDINTTLENIGVRGARAKIAIVTTKAEPTTNTYPELTKLHKLLIEPIQSALPKDPNQKVILIPQGQLFLLPFAAFRDPQGKSLIESHTLSIAPSIQSLTLTKPKKKPLFTKPLIIGDPTMPTWPGGILQPLPGARKEAQTLSQLLSTPALIGPQATETTVVQQMPQASLLHFATHGLLDAIKGETPGAIALTSSPQDDGFLNSSEILNLNLQAELAVLSACDTGRGTITGDGVIGLSRSFAIAGVPSVVVSLWSVGDSTTEYMMTQFYQALKEGKPKATALREAMLNTQKKFPNPLAWSAFTLVGSPD